jgi:hypothetical protein
MRSMDKTKGRSMARRVAGAFLIAAILVAVGLLVQRSFLGDRGTGSGGAKAPGTDAGADARPPGPSRVTVASANGVLEKRSRGGGWTVLEKGAELDMDDEIRTGPDGSATLELGTSVTVHVSERTELTVAQVSNTVSRLRLDDGRLSSEVRGAADFRFRIEVRGTDAVAESSSGHFVTFRRGQGPVTVAATEGNVRVTAKQKTVEVAGGEQSVVPQGSAPAPPTKIPPSIFLKVGKPSQGKTPDEASLSGQTLAGAVVSINGVDVPVQGNGEFATSVALREGDNDIVVKVEDPLGRTASQTLPKIRLDPKPRVRGTVSW